MAVTLTPVGYTPGQSQFGLDKIIVHYKCDQNAVVVLTDPSVPQKGDVLHATAFPFMFLTDRDVRETGESAAALDLVYEGALKDDGEGNPSLPASKTNKDRAIKTSTSYTSSAIFPLVATLPASLEYYASTVSLVVMSHSDSSDATYPDPDDVTTADLISWTLAAEQPAGTFDGIATWLLENAFVQRVIETSSSDEIVAGQFWRITKRKTRQLYPYAPSS